MKKLISLTFFAFLWINMVAQAPQAINYQAVARNSSGQVLASQSVSFKISILSGSATGTAVYTETHPGKTTNQFGLVNLAIGKGTPVTGTFSSVAWDTGTYYIKVEMDPAGGSSYQALGTSQLLSVPFALHSKTVELEEDGDAANELQDLELNGTVLGLTKSTKTVTLPSSSGGDNWGTDYVHTDATLAGQGTTSSPLKIAQQSATNGQVLKWNGTTWSPANDEAGGGALTLPYSGSASFASDPVFNITNTGNGSGIKGKSNATSGVYYGVIGESSSVNGTGVYGVAPNTGVEGIAHAANGTAIYGYAYDSEGTNYAIRGVTNSSNGYSGYFNGGRFHISGNTGIGTTNPGAKLEVAGQVKITGGSPGNGKVLTSDATGLASWQEKEPCRWDYVGSYVDNGQIKYNIAYTDGKVGIGTIAPSAMFELQGSFRYNYGSPGQGKVLTSDDSGFVSWATPSGGGLTLPYSGTASSEDFLFEIKNSGSGNGIVGSTIAGTAVLGNATAEASANIGVAGQSSSSSGVGVWGNNISASAGGIGVRGFVTNAGGYSGFFTGGMFYVNGKIGINKQNPVNALSVSGQADISDKLVVGGTTQTGRLLVANADGSGNALSVGSASGDNAWFYFMTEGLIFDVYRISDQRRMPVLIQPNGGKVGIGTKTPTEVLHVVGNAYKTEGGTTWLTSSDLRLKTLLGNYDKGLKEIAALQPVRFIYNKNNPRNLSSDTEQSGFVAQEVQKIFPVAVTEAKDGYLDFNMHEINVALVNAVKELKAENERLKEENEKLKTKDLQVENRLEKLEQLVGAMAEK